MSGIVVGAVVGGYVATSIVVGVVAGAVVGYVVGDYIIDALTPDLPGPSDGGTQGALANKPSSNDPIPIIYGTRRIGATRVFLETEGTDNKYLHQILVLAEGEIDSVTEVWIDDDLIGDSKYDSFVTTTIHTGADDQSADSTLQSTLSNWTSDHRLRGVAYAYVKLEYDQDTFVRGIPTVTFTVKGAKVFDPRDSSTAWSDNPALCIRDYLTNTRYGRGLPSSEIDDTSFISAANYCDELVDLTGGGSTVKRYTCNGIVNTESASIPILKALVSCCRGMLVFTAGTYKLIIDKAESTGFAFTENNVIGGWNIQMGSKRNRYNKIKADFTNKETSWRDDIAISESSTYKTNDNDLKLEKTIKLPFNTDIERAQMLCALTLNQSRQQIAVTFIATIEALQAEVGEVVSITADGMGWSSKAFRIERMDIKSSSEVKVTVREYDSTVYDFGTVDEQDSIPNTNLPTVTTAVAPTNIIATESLYSTRDNGIKAKVDLSWTASDDQFVREYEWGYLKNGDSTYTTGVTRSTSYTIYDIDPAKYTFRVKAINSTGVSSGYATLIQEIAGLLTAPSALTDVNLQAVSSLAILSWSESTDLDVKNGGKIEVRHSNLLSDATWSNSVSIGTALAGTATVAVLPLLSGTYIIRAVDSSGIYSSSATVTTEAATVQAYSTVDTVQAHPNWSGTHDDTVAVDGVLRLQGNSDVDDWASVDAVSSIDLGTTGVDVGGTYTFSAGIDAGSVKRQRLVRDLTMTTINNAATMDARTTNIDSWIDFDQTDNLSANAIVYVRTTDDDPTGSPTWGGWEKLEVVEYNHRAFEFKVDVTSPDIDHNIRLSELTITSQEIV